MDLQEQVDQGVVILRRGGVVAYPTDTVYGLGARMDSEKAVARIFEVKSRPRQMSLPLLVSTVSQIEELTDTLSDTARCLIAAFLPGAVTLVLPASKRVPVYLRTPENTVALRIPNHPIPLALINSLGTAIIGTSANLSGQPNPLTATEVASQIGPRVDLIIDGGRCSGTESTIIDVTGVAPVLLRQGAVLKTDIEKACGRVLPRNGG